ncbi:MAG: hypothetical protein CMM50_09975 [Rhodospirillaceae bacterium]|nr:hypothetical protein [Rhodospirillaceae bacterium]
MGERRDGAVGGMLRRVEVLTRRVALLGIAALFVAIAITIVDVLLRAVAGFGILGTIDMIQLCTMVAVFAAIPYAFAMQEHVGVDFVLHRMPPRLAAFFQGVGMLAAVAMMLGIGWYGWLRMMQQGEFGDSSQTIGIPIAFYWVPLLVAAVLSVLATAMLAVAYFARAAGAAVALPAREDVTAYE